jgi:hypothetical protein
MQETGHASPGFTPVVTSSNNMLTAISFTWR